MPTATATAASIELPVKNLQTARAMLSKALIEANNPAREVIMHPQIGEPRAAELVLMNPMTWDQLEKRPTLTYALEMLLSGEEVSPEDKQADWWGWIKFWVRPIAKLQFVNQLRSVLGKKLLTSIVLMVEPDKPDSQNQPGQLRLSEVIEENSTGQEATGPSTKNFFRQNTQGLDAPTLGASKSSYMSSHKSPRHLDKGSSRESSKGASGFLAGLFSPRGSSAEAAAPAAAPSPARPGSAKGPMKSPRGTAEKAAAPAAAGLQKVAL